MRRDFRGQRHGFCTRVKRARRRSLPHGGKAKSVTYEPERSRRRVFICARQRRALAVRNINLIRAKAFAKDKGSIGSEGVLRRLSDLMSTFGRKLGKFQENNAERTFVREHCCLESIRRRTGCSPSRWRSRRHEHKNLLKFLCAVSQSARISDAQEKNYS